VDALVDNGFRRVPDFGSASFLVQANLKFSDAAPGPLIGSTIVLAQGDFWRDWVFAKEAGAISQATDPGTIVAEAYPYADGELRIDRDRLDGIARHMYDFHSEVIDGMCEWRHGVVEDGLTIEQLRQELVKEMVRVRTRSRAEKQRKELQIGVDPDSALP
jgi:hypothetical protein